MTKNEQMQLVADLSASITNRVLSAIAAGKVPSTWDGHELREYLADLCAFERTRLMRDDRKRKREYKNHVLVNNL